MYFKVHLKYKSMQLSFGNSGQNHFDIYNVFSSVHIELKLSKEISKKSQ